MSSFGKESAELEREVEAQRNRVEARIGEIRDRLSPGQLIDELMSYSKEGGQHFVSNLGQTITANPLPAALLGVSLVWLMSGKGTVKEHHAENSYRSSQWDDDYPYASVTGGLRRTAHEQDEAGEWYTSFADESGRSYRAKSNEKGHRLGHFMDDAGRKFGGFIDDAGHRVKDFRDEAGNRLEEAAGWASHTWEGIQRNIGNMAGQLANTAQNLGGGVQHQAGRANRIVMDTFQSQPLVAGGLAFAAGAALGAALPHTKQEDEVVGKLSDKVRSQATNLAAEAYEEGKSRAGEVYEKAKEGAAELFEKVTGDGGQHGTEESRRTGEFH